VTIRADAHKPDFHRAAPPQLPVRVATTASVTISTALNNGDSIDGVTLATGDRVLVKDQSTGSQNGIYIVGASPARAFDFAEGVAAYGALIYVVAGTANGGKLFRCSNTTVPTIDSTALTFVDYTPSSGGSALTVKDEGSNLDTAVTSIDFVGAGVVATNSTHAVTVTISGGSGASAEDPVFDMFGSPTTAFEFDSSSLTGLTAMGSATAEAAHTTVPSNYYVKKAATSSVALTGRYASAPSAPFTAICKLTDATFVPVNFQRAGGLFIAEGSPGKVEAIHLLWNAAQLASVVNYTNPTTFNATIGTDIAIPAVALPLYYAIVVTSSTSVAYAYSFNGRIWRTQQSGRNPAFTIGSVGICVDPENATHGVAGAYDFLRIFNSALTLPGV
jgi:hypothetical protein